MKSPKKRHAPECWKNQAVEELGVGGDLASCTCGLDKAEKNAETLYPTNQDIDAHNDKIATMLELVQRNQELKERVRELEAELIEARIKGE